MIQWLIEISMIEDQIRFNPTMQQCIHLFQIYHHKIKKLKMKYLFKQKELCVERAILLKNKLLNKINKK